MRLMIRWPETGKLLPTGVAMDPGSFERSNFVSNAASCPHCGGTHRWSKADAILMDEPSLN